VAVKNRLYDDVVVNSVKLQIAEMRALTSKNAAASLLNKVSVLLMEYQEKTTDLSQITDKRLSHNVVHLALIEIRTHNIK
jgi:hypothetical protein